MISSLRGTVIAVSASSSVIEAGGVGFAFFATPATLSTLREGDEARVFTSLVVREDSMSLYGFADADERDTFDILQGVSGVGPKKALTILSVHTPDILRGIVARQDVAALQQVPGIGKKGAQKLILEIGTKLGPEHGGAAAGAAAAPSTPQGSDVVEALVGLGWSEADAYAGYEKASADNPGASVPELLRASLQVLGSRR